MELLCATPTVRDQADHSQWRLILENRKEPSVWLLLFTLAVRNGFVKNKKKHLRDPKGDVSKVLSLRTVFLRNGKQVGRFLAVTVVSNCFPFSRANPFSPRRPSKYGVN